MRVSGRFEVDAQHPSAKGICDRCGFQYTHRDLQWQMQFAGVKLQNLRLLVCRECLDVPQPQLKVIILPADPLPIMNPRSENYTVDDNPVSPLGYPIGTLVGFGGLNGAISMGINKSYVVSAGLPYSKAGFNNSVGRNWGPNVTQTLSTVDLYAPNDSPFLGVGTAYKIQGSNDGVTFTDIFTGATAGGIAEVITLTIPNGTPYQYHQVNFNGDGVSRISISQLVINSANQAPQGDD